MLLLSVSLTAYIINLKNIHKKFNEKNKHTLTTPIN